MKFAVAASVLLVWGAVSSSFAVESFQGIAFDMTPAAVEKVLAAQKNGCDAWKKYEAHLYGCDQGFKILYKRRPLRIAWDDDEQKIDSLSIAFSDYSVRAFDRLFKAAREEYRALHVPSRRDYVQFDWKRNAVLEIFFGPFGDVVLELHRIDTVLSMKMVYYRDDFAKIRNAALLKKIREEQR